MAQAEDTADTEYVHATACSAVQCALLLNQLLASATPKPVNLVKLGRRLSKLQGVEDPA